ncbi:MAG: DUF2848 domain-containing protein [Alphaproteobacteria bacterium]|nr:MAG: DUF2848 domain-containing protein [Alphaproteobacteria bacterium]
MRFETSDGMIEAPIDALIVAGWTGRDGAAVQHHIDELAAIGVTPPSRVPLFYRVSNTLVTQTPEIQVLGEHTSGEVEPLLLNISGILWLGLGSDHTDRALETVSVAASKQACAKPVAPGLWPMKEVEDHLDRLVLRCHIKEHGDWSLYQEGTLAAIRPLDELARDAELAPGGAMLCGTVPAQGPIRPGVAWRMVLEDPLRECSLALSYRVTTLPAVS